MRATTPLKAIRHGLPRQYARMRLGVTKQEARAYNRTDRVLLTFDDYGTPGDVRKILDILEGEHIKGMFFLQGDWCEKNEELVNEIAARGHWLGSHTYSHARLDKLSDEAIRSELHRGLQTDLIRPPYGAYNDHVRKLAAKLGFKIAFWTIDSHDWHGISAAEIQQLILPQLHKGACVLMHLNAPHTIEALPGLIAGIKARGYELCHDGTEIQISA